MIGFRVRMGEESGGGSGSSSSSSSSSVRWFSDRWMMPVLGQRGRRSIARRERVIVVLAIGWQRGAKGSRTSERGDQAATEQRRRRRRSVALFVGMRTCEVSLHTTQTTHSRATTPSSLRTTNAHPQSRHTRTRTQHASKQNPIDQILKEAVPLPPSPSLSFSRAEASNSSSKASSSAGSHGGRPGVAGRDAAAGAAR